MTTPAGWYPDTEVPGGLRYWDGTVWTEHRTPPAGAQPEPAAAETVAQQATPDDEFAGSEQATSIVKLPTEHATTVIPARPPVESTPETPVADAALEPTEPEEPAADPVFPATWETPPMPSWDAPAAAAAGPEPSSETQMAPTFDAPPSYQPPASTYQPPVSPYQPPVSQYEAPTTPPSSYGPPTTPPPGYGPPATPPAGYGPPSTPPGDAPPSYAASYPPPGPPGYPPPGAPAGGGGGGNNKVLFGIIGGAAALLLIVALVLVYFFVINTDDDKTVSADSSTSQTKSRSSESSQTETSDTETTESETTAAAPPGGEVVDGPFSFRVATVDTYDTIESSDIDGLEVAADGIFLIVEIDVTNTSDASASFLLTQQTLNANGESIRPDDEGNFYANGNVVVEIAPGETANVAVAFDVPPGTTGDSIRVYGDMMSQGTDLPLS